MTLGVGTILSLLLLLWRRRGKQKDKRRSGLIKRRTVRPSKRLFVHEPLDQDNLVAAKTRSKSRSEVENQDAMLIFSQRPQYRLLAVADGVGMAAHSAVASKVVVEAFRENIDELSANDKQASLELIAEFYTVAVNKIKQALEDKDLPPQSAATTFIGVVEYPDHYLLTYLGDGSAFWVEQSFDGFEIEAKAFLLNGASPDRPPQMGAGGKSEEPKTLLISKPEGQGFIWVIATDGMNNFERYMEDGSKVNGEQAIALLFQEIWDVFRESPYHFTRETLEAVLDHWIKKCQTTDDATVAILISEELFANWHRLLTQGKKQQSANYTSRDRRRFRYGDEPPTI